VILIAGGTGSGKSTQVPQFILETCEQRNEPCRIICTQPHGLAAKAVSERIALERGEPIGSGTIGFQVRLESKISPRTICTMCTYRVLLRTLLGREDSHVAHITHIIIDEVHERSKISDFLLIELRSLLAKHPHLRLVLMASAIDLEVFQSYFNRCPLLDVPARAHSVEEFFLEDVLEMTQYSTERMKKLERSQMGTAYLSRDGDDSLCSTSVAACLKVAHNSDTLASKCVPQLDPQVARDMDQIINNVLEEDLDNEDNFDQLFCLILSDNVNVDYANSHSGVTPLMAVCKAGHLPSVQRLLRLGASIMMKTKVTEKTAFDFARVADNGAEVVEMLQGFMENERLTPITGNSVINGGGKLLAGTKETEQRLGIYHACFDDEQVDIQLLVTVVKYVIDLDKTNGSILVFLPGLDEIIQMSEALNAQKFINKNPKLKILFLHSKLQLLELQQVFKPCPPGHRKIILATDIAETSVTIDDITVVIDSGKGREKPYDTFSSASLFKSTNWISKINAGYRKLRAGRVIPGSCYRLYSRGRYETFAKVVVPEIQRVPLEELCLHTKVIAPSDVSITEYLSRAPSPPSMSAIQNAIFVMKNIDALDKDEELTELGHHLVDLPLPPHLGKMVLYSIILRCVDPVLTIASALAYRDPFLIPLHPSQKRESSRAKTSLADRTCSDHVSLLRVFQEWNRSMERDRSYRRDTEETTICERNFVSSSTMRVIFDIRTKLLQELRALKFIHTRGGGDMRDLNVNSERWPMVKGALCAGLYPNLLRVDRTKGEAMSPKEGKVRFHSSSVLYQAPNHVGDTVDIAHQQCVMNLPTDWLIFEKVGKSTRHATVKCCTAISAITVALFAGNTRQLTMQVKCSFVDGFIYLFIRSFIHSFIYLFIYSFIYLFILSFIPSFTDSIIPSHMG
jgi:HrpA-like RNA helicase